MKVKVSKYTASLQVVLKSKTEPAPWLHFGLSESGDFSIFVWDTREVIESGSVKPGYLNKFPLLPVHDNREPLKGETKLEF